MIRTTATSNIGGKAGSSFEAAPLALWTSRNVDTRNRSNNNNISSRSGPVDSGQFHLPFPAAGRLLHTRRLGGPPAGKAVNGGGDRQVEVLTRLPSLYTKVYNNSQQQQPQQQKPQPQQQPEPLPLLHGSKRMKQSKKLQQLKQQTTPTDPEEAGDVEQAEPDPGRSRFRISVADRLPQEQQKQQTQQQPQPQQQPMRVPMAYFGRGSASLHSTLCVDVDSRSCDKRHPDKTAAYSRAAVYIRDNELMPAAKARLIWRWMDELDDATPSAGRLFVYDPASRWFSMAA